MKKEIKNAIFINESNIASYAGRNVYLGIIPVYLDFTAVANSTDKLDFFITINEEKYEVGSNGWVAISTYTSIALTAEPDPYIEWMIDLAKSQKILCDFEVADSLVIERDRLNDRVRELELEVSRLNEENLELGRRSIESYSKNVAIDTPSVELVSTNDSLVSTLVANDMEKYRLMMELLSNGISKKV